MSVNRGRNIPTYCCLGGIVLFSYFLKLLSWWIDPTISRDGSLYIYLAQVWYNSGSIQEVLEAVDDFWASPPLYFYLMQSLMHTGISAEMAGVSLNIFFGTFIPIIMYEIAYTITQRKDIGIISALLIAVNPTTNSFAHEVQRDMSYLFFIGLVLWFLSAGIRYKNVHYWFEAGMGCSLAFLCRFEAAEFFVLIPCIIVFLGFVKHITLKKAIYYIGACFAGFAIVSIFLIMIMQIPAKMLSRYYDFYLHKTSMIETNFTQNEVDLRQ